MKKSKVISRVNCQRSSNRPYYIKHLMLCEENSRLLDAYVRATDRQAEAVRSLSDAAKYNRTAFRDALVHAEQARQDVEEARLALQLHSKTHRC